MTKKSSKKLWIILGIVFLIIAVVTFFINIILGSILHNVIDSQLEAISKKSNKELSVEKVRFNVLSKTLTIKNINIKPDSSYFEDLKQGKLNQASIMDIKIPVLKFHGIGIVDLLVDRTINLKKILLQGVEFTIYRHEYDDIKKESQNSSPISLDSIYIDGINGINLSKVTVDRFSYTTINANTNDTVFSFEGSGFDIKGFDLYKSDNSNGFFRFNTNELGLKMRRQRIDLRNANYFIFLRKLDFSFSDSLITASDLMVKPTSDKYKLGASYKYSKEVFDVETKSIKVYGYKIDQALRFGVLNIDSILIDGLKLEIYKDRSKPFDENKRPLFLQQQLKAMKLPLHIKKLVVNDSKFNFILRPEKSNELMRVGISDINMEASFITSFKDSLQSDKKLNISLNGILMGTSALQLDIIMPYNSPVDTFYFSGELNGGDFKKFNPALFPVTGIKFNGGHLSSMKFYAHASPKSSKGLMTMLYEDLQAEIPKKDVKKKNKFLSFTANTVIRTSNPNKHGKTKVALVKTNRVEYKGFGNLLWKTAQSGLINTILPTGKTHKEEKEIKKQQNKSSKKKTKKKWWKKKK